MIFSLRLITSAFAACVCVQVSNVLAQDFPVPGKPIRIVVPFPPGGTSDIHARHVASKLGPALGASVIVENKPGASTIIGAMAVVKAEPDGHTLLYTLTLTVASNPHLFSKLPYDPIRDFTPITYACNGTTVLAVSTSLPVNNVRELIEHARKNPGKLNFGSWSLGGGGHLNGELLKELAGIDIVHVPYKGSADLVQALASGNVQMAFDGLITARTLEKAGKVKIIAIADDKRALAVPEIPTMAEAGVPGAYASGGFHFFGPANLPRAIVARLNAELVKVLRMQDINEMYTTTGMEVVASTPEEQVSILRTQSERLGSIIRKLGIKLD
jgi:tripartite-type tricarboxylate transporter receptor subunit TctC